MSKFDFSLIERGREMLNAVIDGDVRIISVYADLERMPQDDASAWTLAINTTKNYHFTFYMEGINIAGVKEAIDYDGRRLVDPHRPLNILCGFPGERLALLDSTVLSALDQIAPN